MLAGQTYQKRRASVMKWFSPSSRMATTDALRPDRQAGHNAKIREAEKVSVMAEYGQREGEIVSAQSAHRAWQYFVEMDAPPAFAVREQIPGGEVWPGERVRAYLSVLRSGRVFPAPVAFAPKFLEELSNLKRPEIANGSVKITAIAREAGQAAAKSRASERPHH